MNFIFYGCISQHFLTVHFRMKKFRFRFSAFFGLVKANHFQFITSIFKINVFLFGNESVIFICAFIQLFLLYFRLKILGLFQIKVLCIFISDYKLASTKDNGTSCMRAAWHCAVKVLHVRCEVLKLGATCYMSGVRLAVFSFGARALQVQNTKVQVARTNLILRVACASLGIVLSSLGVS